MIVRAGLVPAIRDSSLIPQAFAGLDMATLGSMEALSAKGLRSCGASVIMGLIYNFVNRFV